MTPTLSEAVVAVRSGDVSPVELVGEAVERAQRLQPSTNAFSQIRGGEALEEAAARAESVARGEALGPLHGVPVAVKDLIDVKGWETSGCSLGYRGNRGRRDAEVVRLLREAGAVIIGKTNQHELAAGGTNLISALGPTRNPWDATRITGGSSGGSGAAVAARVVPLALGTDTGGSIRIPASLCGVSGLKPTTGRVSLEGAMPLAPSLDTVGPMATTVEDLATAFAVLAGTGEAFLTEAAAPVAGLSVGIAGGFFTERVHPEVVAAARDIGDVLEEAGAKVVDVDVGGIRDAPEVWLRVTWPEFATAHGHLLRRPETVYPRTRSFLEEGASQTAVEYLKAVERSRQIRTAFLGWLTDVDVLLAPCTPFAAPSVDAGRIAVGDGQFVEAHASVGVLTRPANLAKLPALAIPAGFSGEGLPLGVQLIGRDGEEAVLLRVGRAVQEATDHHRQVPPLRGVR